MVGFYPVIIYKNTLSGENPTIQLASIKSKDDEITDEKSIKNNKNKLKNNIKFYEYKHF